MASFSPSVTRQTSLTLIAIAQRGRMAAIGICFLLLAGGSSARSQFEELEGREKEELVFYVHQDQVPPDVTILSSASPSGRNDTLEFGTIATINDVIRKGIAKDSTPLGFVKGLLVFEKDLSISATTVYELTTPGRSGTLTAQGILDPNGNGELAITGGTGTYRWARGYLEVLSVSTDPADFIFKDTIHLKYF